MLKTALAFWLLILNLLTFAAMGWDKWKARRKGRRIPERTLFLLAFFGGSLGGLAGMAVFRHKTRHKKFQIGFPLLFLLQAAFLVWLEWGSLPVPAP